MSADPRVLWYQPGDWIVVIETRTVAKVRAVKPDCRMVLACPVGTRKTVPMLTEHIEFVARGSELDWKDAERLRYRLRLLAGQGGSRAADPRQRLQDDLDTVFATGLWEVTVTRQEVAAG